MTKKKEIYLIKYNNTVEEMDNAQRSIHERTANAITIKLYRYLQNFHDCMYDIDDYQMLFVANKNMIQVLILLSEKLGLSITYSIVTVDVLINRKFRAVVNNEFISKIEKVFKPFPTVDDVLDKINLCGLRNLSELELAVLNNY